MKKTYKTKVLEAILKLIQTYEVHKDYIGQCPLCKIFEVYLFNVSPEKCHPCPSTVFKPLPYIHHPCSGAKTHCNIRSKARDDRRAKFWIEVYNIMLTIPPKYFTPSGFSPDKFQFMIDIDNEIAKKYPIIGL